MSLVIPVAYDLYLNNQEDKSAIYLPGWNWPNGVHSIGFTASTVPFELQAEHALVLWAKFHVVWRPLVAASKLALIKCDNGGTNAEILKVVNGEDTPNPVQPVGDFTTEMNQAIAARTFKHFTYQVWGDGIHPISLFRLRLHIGWLYQ